jgi:hypothetical protein
VGSVAWTKHSSARKVASLAMVVVGECIRVSLARFLISQEILRVDELRGAFFEAIEGDGA